MKTTLLFLSVFLSVNMFGQNVYYTQPNCNEIDGLEFDSIISVEDGYTGVAYRCNGDKVGYLEKYLNGDLQMNQVWSIGGYDFELGEKDTLSYLTHTVFKNDKIISKTYNEFGILRYEDNWLNKNEKGFWIRDGVQRTIDENGKIESESNFKNGLRHGISKAVHKTVINDTYVSEANYKNGLYHGISKKFINDTLVSEANYKNGLYHGISKDYDPSNNFQLTFTATWKKNKYHGLMRFYHENGSLAKEILWKKGKIKMYGCSDIDGQPIECDISKRSLRLRNACIDDDGNAIWCDQENGYYNY